MRVEGFSKPLLRRELFAPRFGNGKRHTATESPSKSGWSSGGGGDVISGAPCPAASRVARSYAGQRCHKACYGHSIAPT